MKVGCCPREKGGTIQVDVGPAVMDPVPKCGCFFRGDRAKRMTNRIGQRRVSNDSFSKESRIISQARPIKKLFRQNDISWAILLLQATNRANAYDPPHVQ